MKKVIFISTHLLLLSACNDSSDDSAEAISAVAPHCSQATVLVIEKHRRFEKNFFNTNQCNELFQLTARYTGTYTDQQSPFGYIRYKLKNGDYLSTTSTGSNKIATTIWTNATYSGYYNQYLNGYDLRLNYTYKSGDDFITKYNTTTTNTDFIYSNEEEYQYIMRYSLPALFIEDFNEATKDIKDDNVTVTSR